MLTKLICGEYIVKYYLDSVEKKFESRVIYLIHIRENLSEENVFVNIVTFPPVKKGKDEEFKKWFAWSNTVYEKFDGFISRRLLKPVKGGNYAAIVEHDTEETFMAMHLSKERQKAWEKVESLLEGKPKPGFYDAIIVSETKR